MWKKILERFEAKSNDNDSHTRRRFPRRAIDTCAISVEGTTYPIKDWSKTGALFATDGRSFEEDSTLPVIMKFRMADQVMEVSLQARVIRSYAAGIAIEFLNVDAATKNAFARVIDHALASDFADTQVSNR